MIFSRRGLILTAVQGLLVVGVAGKYTWDRQRLPRVWVRSIPVDPTLPIRGRYVDLRLELLPVEVAPPDSSEFEQAEEAGGPRPPRFSPQRVSLFIHQDRLAARADRTSSNLAFWRSGPDGPLLVLQQSVPFFIPENIPDPSILQPDEELWVEVSVPEAGLPRPLRIAIQREGQRRDLPYR